MLVSNIVYWYYCGQCIHLPSVVVFLLVLYQALVIHIAHTCTKTQMGMLAGHMKFGKRFNTKPSKRVGSFWQYNGNAIHEH